MHADGRLSHARYPKATERSRELLDSIAHRELLHFTHVLIPTDLSPTAPHLVRYACEIVVAAGNPVALIVHMARARTVDLIVMGTHGYTGLRHILWGSVAERVIRLAPCPVLVVRHQEEIDQAATTTRHYAVAC
jgi:Universal stress protein family